jgi:hypothetical protein
VIGEEFLDAERSAFVCVIEAELQVAVFAVAVTEYGFVRVRLLVGGNDSFVVSQYNFVGGPRNEIVGHYGNLAAASRGVDYVGGYAESGGMADEAFQDFYSLAHGRAEMGKTFGQVALVKIIRADAIVDQFVNQ